ncbi:hypothetical protein DFH09DRAFT_1366558 [Mycena vulgaris]|nr:hypothetical protein DFH09DRAFT_1366558 [Mycena vulgaris]
MFALDGGPDTPQARARPYDAPPAPETAGASVSVSVTYALPHSPLLPPLSASPNRTSPARSRPDTVSAAVDRRCAASVLAANEICSPPLGESAASLALVTGCIPGFILNTPTTQSGSVCGVLFDRSGLKRKRITAAKPRNYSANQGRVLSIFSLATLNSNAFLAQDYKGCKYKQPILALEYPKIWIPFASSFAAAIPIVVIIRPLSCVFSKGINIRFSASETTLSMCVVAIVALVVGDISPSTSRPVRPFLIFFPAACSNLAF